MAEVVWECGQRYGLEDVAPRGQGYLIDAGLASAKMLNSLATFLFICLFACFRIPFIIFYILENL